MAIKKDINGKPISRDYEDFLSEQLQDPQEARSYLNAALEEEDHRVFLLALRDVAKAHGISRIASETKLNRESLYKMLSESGNPQVSSLVALLRAVGVRLSTDVIAKDQFIEHHEENLKVSALSCVPERRYTQPEIAGDVEFFQPSQDFLPQFDYSGLEQFA
jgi:probable addiction module antidote protein